MTPTFDFAAFLNSPGAGTDGSYVQFPSLPSGLTHSLSNHLVDTLDSVPGSVPFDSLGDASIIPDWATSTAFSEVASKTDGSLSSHGVQASQDTEMHTSSDQDSVTKPVPTNYRSGIAAHHLSQLRSWLPQLGGSAGGAPAGLGGAGQRSLGGSFSSPSVPLSQAARMKSIKDAKQLTLQERRRLSRRAQAVGAVHTPAIGSSLINESRRSSDTPSTTDNAPTQYQMGPPTSPIYNTQFSNEGSAFAKKAYSYTGFDLIGALLRVAQRPNPKIEIGPVDLSCSFTVSDARHPDQPIVYCSDTFCSLTGYTRDEIIGQNCRFLQAPGGEVDKGTERLHTDNGAVKHIRKHCAKLQECQTSLINYRKDGSPFINLVTIIPITWGDSTEPVFLVGFQVDLVEQPGAVLERTSNGLYVVNYSQTAQHGRPSLHSLTDPHNGEHGDALMKDPAEEEAGRKAMMSQELAELIGSGSEETSRWARVLLENSHDLIHVLSLKGTFLYVSPSVERLLGYSAEEMVGRSISEFCHPSDVVPVFRELKDSTSNSSIAAAARHWARVDGTVNPPTKGGAGQTGPQVNLIMRMRHKERGYEWIENVGKLHLEQGKGRKVVISTGRARPVYNLPWDQARRSLEHKGPGFWSKLSQTGLILSTSGSIKEVFNGEPQPSADGGAAPTLAGMHVGDTVSAEAKESILTALQSCNVTGIPHEMKWGPTGQMTTVMSTLIPSSAGGEGLHTVFMHTQKVSMADLGALQLNKIHTRDASSVRHVAEQAASLKKGEPAGNSIFGELSTHRSSSWVFELHQLKITNRRLREEIRAHQRRMSGARPILKLPPPSPSKNRTSSKAQISIAFLSAPSHGANGANGSGSSSDASSLEPSPLLSRYDTESRTNTSSGSSSDSTVATSVISTGSANPSTAGIKRARS